MPRRPYTEDEIKAAMRVQARGLVERDAHFGNVVTPLKSGVLALAVAQSANLEQAGWFAEVLFEEMIGRFEDARDEVVEAIAKKRDDASAAPAVIGKFVPQLVDAADVDRNASRWPGGHTHPPAASCVADVCPKASQASS